MIGTGNTANVLGRKILKSGHHILQVVGRNTAHAKALSVLLHAPSFCDFSDITDDADIYIIAVSDAALADIHNLMPEKKQGIVVHTAGAVGKCVLIKVSQHYGVLYPLQSLRSDSQTIPEIPFLIDADCSDTLQRIQSFASSLSQKVVYADDITRIKLHAGAVMVNNFTNYLYGLTQDFCAKEELDFSLLLPLLFETVNRLEQYPAGLMQTGPAMRNDQDTITKHLSLLQTYPALSRLYTEISGSITHYYHSSKEN